MQIRFLNFLDTVLKWLEPSNDRLLETFEMANYEHDGHMSIEDLKDLVEKTHALPMLRHSANCPAPKETSND